MGGDLPTPGAGSGSLVGSLLVATPLIDEPVFRRTVVLVVDHDADGTLGVVLNRPTRQQPDPAFAPLAPATAAPAVVFDGGPVQPDLTVALSGGGAGLCAWSVLDRRAPPPLPAPVRLFRGYAGWSPDQLQHEVRDGAWWVLAPEPTDLFGPAPTRLWRDVVRRQPAPMAFASTWLADARLN